MSKCHFRKKELHSLGHVVGKEAIEVDPWKTKFIIKWHKIFEIGQLQYFMGFAITFAYSSMDILLW